MTKNYDKILAELKKIIEKDAATPKVISRWFKYSRIQSAENERQLARETQRVLLRDEFVRAMNPFYLKPEEANAMSKGEIVLGVTPEGYVVSYDLEREFIMIVAGASGGGKSTLLASTIIQVDRLNGTEENNITGFLE